MERHMIKFHAPMEPGGFWCELDGKPLWYVREFSVSTAYDKATEVSITLLADVDGDVEMLAENLDGKTERPD